MKREKNPPLKPWQLEVVKKHEVRNRLLKGSSYDRAKYWYMMTQQISEEEFDRDAERIMKTVEFRGMLFRQELSTMIAGWATSIRGIFSGF